MLPEGISQSRLDALANPIVDPFGILILCD